MSQNDTPASATPDDVSALADGAADGAPAASPTGAEDAAQDKSEEKADEKIDWFAEIRGLALMLLAVLAFHSLVAKPFYIPSTSMMPSLHVGDRLVVSKYPYGWSWASASFHMLPRSETRIWGATPEYGDIVIPVHPTRNEDYIKRVVGLPGDTIEVRDGKIILNGTPIKREMVPAVRIPFEPELLCPRENAEGKIVQYPCLDDFNDTRTVGADGEIYFQPDTYKETLPNGATYLIIDHLNQTFDNYGPYEVPDDHVFVMGDNRDHSADSRAPVNPIGGGGLGDAIPLENIGGRAEFITFSLDGSTGWNPVTWYTSLRGERAWTTLRPAISESAKSE